jgi:hypothetical protein
MTAKSTTRTLEGTCNGDVVGGSCGLGDTFKHFSFYNDLNQQGGDRSGRDN